MIFSHNSAPFGLAIFFTQVNPHIWSGCLSTCYHLLYHQVRPSYNFFNYIAFMSSKSSYKRNTGFNLLWYNHIKTSDKYAWAWKYWWRLCPCCSSSWKTLALIPFKHRIKARLISKRMVNMALYPSIMLAVPVSTNSSDLLNSFGS